MVEDRFYNHAKYKTLSPDQNNELRIKRKHRGGDDNERKRGNDRRSNGKRIREDKRKKDKKTIKSLTCTIAALCCKTDDPTAKANLMNSSLTRQRGS
jgi:hypothetical protein